MAKLKAHRSLNLICGLTFGFKVPAYPLITSCVTHSQQPTPLETTETTSTQQHKQEGKYVSHCCTCSQVLIPTIFSRPLFFSHQNNKPFHIMSVMCSHWNNEDSHAERYTVSVSIHTKKKTACLLFTHMHTHTIFFVL